MSMLSEYMPEFIAALEAQLDSDELRYGPTWKHRDVGNQTERVFARYRDYHDQYRFGEVAMPWLKVVGNAYIAWVRDNHPEDLLDE